MSTRPTGKSLQSLLPKVLSSIARTHKDRPDLIVASFPEIIGEKLASMTQAISFVDGVLLVHVSNATLYSILVKQESARLTQMVQARFPNTKIHSIRFRMGSLT